jgi:hypothetical protein
MVTFGGVPSTEIDDVWNDVVPIISDALIQARETPDAAYKMLRSKAAQLWVAREGNIIRAVCITQIAENTLGRTCGTWICIGTSREDWKHNIETIEAWARENACLSMRLETRPGWKRALEPLGYSMTHVILEKEL